MDNSEISRLARYLASAFYPDSESAKAIAWFEADVRKQIAGLSLDRPLLPQKYETVAVAFTNMKTAALVYDRIWSPPAYAHRPPEHIAVYGGTDFEIWLQATTVLVERAPDLARNLRPRFNSTPLGVVHAPASLERDLSEAIMRESGINATPIYSSVANRQREYKAGDYEVIVGTLANLAVVDESALTWDQVAEFRNDAQMRSHYRRFVHWLDAEMLGKSQRFIEDELHQRLEDYHAALKKHGVQTAIGTLEGLIDPRFVGALSVLFTGIALTAGVPAAAATTLSLSIGQMACRLARAATDISTIRQGPNAAIAYVYELKRAGEKL